jgi:hypothetical protein
MKLSDLISKLQALKDKHGDLNVFYRHGASGDSGPVGTPHVTDRVDEQGPFDVEGPYVALRVGH